MSLQDYTTDQLYLELERRNMLPPNMAICKGCFYPVFINTISICYICNEETCEQCCDEDYEGDEMKCQTC